MPARVRAATPQPIAAINITPLIDVLLVLLIMMILTLPTMTHEIPVMLPQPGPPRAVDPGRTHRLEIAASGALRLDGAAVAEAALPRHLRSIVSDADALLTLDTDAATRYRTFDRILAVIKRSGITRLGFVGNDRFVDGIAR